MYNLNRRRLPVSKLESLKMNVLVAATFLVIFSGTCIFGQQLNEDDVDEILNVNETDEGDQKMLITDAKGKPLGQSFISENKNYEIEKPANESVCLLSSMDKNKVTTAKDICYTRVPVNVDFLDEQIKKTCEGRKVYIMKETPCKKLRNRRSCRRRRMSKRMRVKYRYCRKYRGSRCVQYRYRTFYIRIVIYVYFC